MREPIVVVGAGLSGSLLVQALADGRGDHRVLLVDPLDHPTHERAWAFFEPDHDPVDDALAARRYRTVRITGPHGDQLLHLREHSYTVLDGTALAARTEAALAAIGARRRGTVTSVLPDDGQLSIDGDTVAAGLVLDSVGIGRTDPAPVAWLHFAGWQVRTDRPSFDPSVVTLMDFRTPQRGQLRFVYVLPVTEHEALVELTGFSDSPRAPARAEEDLTAYLDASAGASSWRAEPAEAGRIPLGGHGPPRSQRSRGPHAAPTVRVGSAAHMVKASTGYGVQLMQRDARALAADLDQRRRTRGLHRRPRHRWLDTVFLRLAVSDPARLLDALERMFSANPVDLVVRFLNEETRPREEARLIATLPVRPFATAALHRTPHRDPRRTRRDP